MSSQDLTQVYGVSQYAIEVNLEGITHKESLITPQNQGNCINWVAGHILNTRDLFLTSLGGEAFLTQDEGKPYGRGAQPLKENDSCVDLERIREGLKNSSQAFNKIINNFSQEELDEQVDPELFPVKMENPTRGALLTLILFHESYHCGQLSAIRWSLGKEGVIK